MPEFSFVLGNPPDPVADIDVTLDFIRKLKRGQPGHRDRLLHLYARARRKATLYDEATRLGFKFPETLERVGSGDWRSFSQRRDPRTPWFSPELRRSVRDFERVINAYYPTVTDSKLDRYKRAVLRTLGGWRYHTGIYSYPLELRAFHKFFQYQRPETAGF